jgi:hypothetical protein
MTKKNVCVSSLLMAVPDHNGIQMFLARLQYLLIFLSSMVRRHRHRYRHQNRQIHRNRLFLLPHILLNLVQMLQAIRPLLQLQPSQPLHPLHPSPPLQSLLSLPLHHMQSLLSPPLHHLQSLLSPPLHHLQSLLSLPPHHLLQPLSLLSQHNLQSSLQVRQRLFLNRRLPQAPPLHLPLNLSSRLQRFETRSMELWHSWILHLGSYGYRYRWHFTFSYKPAFIIGLLRTTHIVHVTLVGSLPSDVQ